MGTIITFKNVRVSKFRHTFVILESGDFAGIPHFIKKLRKLTNIGKCDLVIKMSVFKFTCCDNKCSFF